jgi:8-oxo-dGTP pyrophosphatase MutT (NUDIX family)
MSSPAQAPAEPRPSATVLIIRDGPTGLEVYMVARERQVDMASGAVVFPGGKLDADDRSPVFAALAPDGGPDRAHWIAAVRETFEETGLLIAHRADGRPLDGETAAAVREEFRTPLLDGRIKFSEVMTAAGLVPALDLMAPFAHWITPASVPKRFDTHFFLLSALPGQEASPDMREAVKGFWRSPTDLVADADAGRMTLVPATKWNIALLGESTTVSDAFAATRARPVRTVMPTMEKADGGIRLSIRTDAGYKNCEILMRRP